ncbi:MAG: cytosolic protein, partial [Methylomonas sp.]
LWVLDWLMRLPDALNKRLRNEIVILEESEKMRYVTSFERLAMEEGMEKGMEKGREEGREEGRLEGEIILLKKLMARRFGELPAWAEEKFTAASEQDVERWVEAVLTAPSLSAVFNDHLPH